MPFSTPRFCRVVASCALAALVSSSLLAMAGAGPSTAVDELIHDEMRRLRLPGAAVGWIENGELVWARGYRRAEVAERVSVTPETLFFIGSTSKVFIAVSVLQLAARGELALDDPAVKVLPELGPAYAAVTLRHLLSHSGGISRDAKLPGPPPYLSHQLYGDELLAHLASGEPLFPPGTSARYSNLGPALLSLVVERKSGLSLAEYLRQNVFGPAGMTSTRLVPPSQDPRRIEGLVPGMVWTGSRPREAGLESRHPTGSIVSNVKDLAAFLEALWSGRLLPPESLEPMWSIQALGGGEPANLGTDGSGRRYLAALGWFVHPGEDGPDIIHHGGSMEGFSSEIDIEPANRRAVIVLANNETGPAAELAWAMLDHARHGDERAALERRLEERLREVPFDLDRWTLEASTARVESFLDRPSLHLEGGIAWVEDLEFTDGVIDFDVAFADERGFVGVVWRLQDARNYEQLYLRPHQSGNPDANQYTPAFDGSTGWQLYHGPGYGAPVEYRFDDWNRVRIVVAGERADIYINDLRRPAISVRELKRPITAGRIGFTASLTPARFSSLRVLAGDPPPLRGDVPGAAAPEGALMRWQVSDPFPWADLGDDAQLPSHAAAERSWRALECEPQGLANLARLATRDGDSNTVFARATLVASEERTVRLRFGYSDRARVYLNGRLLYAGDNGYRSRDYRYLGTIGWFDAAYLPLVAGKNELWIAVAEDFGGWGVQAALDGAEGVTVLE